MKSNRNLIVLISLCALAGAARSSAAQVGHAPTSSPYHYIEAPRSLGVSVGYLWGDLGDAGVGPSNGLVMTGAFDIRLGTAIGISINAGMLALERTVIQPQDPPATRIRGQFRQNIAVGDVGLELMLTGRKTWRGFAPYLAGAMGIGFGQEIQAEEENFGFSTKFLLIPGFGTRYYLSDRLIINLEARDVMWRLSYPDSYFQPADDGSPPVLDRQVDSARDWTHHFVLMFGLSYGLGF